jgi:hypothetical protein
VKRIVPVPVPAVERNTIMAAAAAASSTPSVLEGNEQYRVFIDSLVEANVDRHVELPMIAVMGDTSSGTCSK